MSRWCFYVIYHEKAASAPSASVTSKIDLLFQVFRRPPPIRRFGCCPTASDHHHRQPRFAVYARTAMDTLWSPSRSRRGLGPNRPPKQQTGSLAAAALLVSRANSSCNDHGNWPPPPPPPLPPPKNWFRRWWVCAPAAPELSGFPENEPDPEGNLPFFAEIEVVVGECLIGFRNLKLFSAFVYNL